jgi:purine-cytosine permease-like protein
MESEVQFIAFLVAPWAVVLLALFFYRRRRARKNRAAETDHRESMR